MDSTTDVTADEMFDNLGGFDEIAIKRSFGTVVGFLMRDDPTMYMRALVFVHLRHEGAKDDAAFDQVMDMGLEAVRTYFAKADSPESGKGESRPGSGPTT